MKKIPDSGRARLKIPSRKILLIMKLTFVLTCCLVFGLQAAVTAQKQVVSLNLENVSVAEAIGQLGKQTKLDFFFSNKEVDVDRKVSLELKKVRLDEALLRLLGEAYVYEFRDAMVIIKPVVRPDAVPQVKELVLSGSVKDDKGEALPGVTVTIKGTSLGVATDIDGKWNLKVPEMKEVVLVFSFVGMKTQEVLYKGQKEINVVMEADAQEMDEVVVTGIFTKAKESYTGAATTITKDDLKRAGNRNILTSIRNIDPSFNILDNPTMGSDPNSLPDITVRGNSSMTSNVRDLQSDSRNTQNANLPLFIMDGFEISLERMMDLDDNQVESITLLKDASATAMYGTRGANGVVVITTKVPEHGRLQITYKGGIDLEAPDLTTYDLLNAKDKLQYEKEAGLYQAYGYTNSSNAGSAAKVLESLYNSRLMSVQRGVNTYWLKYPVRTGVGHNHSLRLEGGREEIRYAIGLQYKNIAGAMKGSDRNTFNGNMFLSYKLGNVTFQNDLQISSNKSINSPYGTFSDYAKINSYWKPYDDEGNLLQVLDERHYSSLGGPGINSENVVYNPLYNAYLPGINESKYTQITNNFGVEWNIVPGLLVRGRLGVTSRNNRSDNYKSASHTDFLNYSGEDYERRGRYSLSTGEMFKYEADITLNFNKTLKEVHQIYAGAGFNFAQDKSETYETVGEGIPDDYSDFLGLAAMYQKEGKPYGDEGISRRVGGILNVNYTYDRRYFVDFSGKVEGSSKFGADNRMAPFWSAGIGWNVHQEHFLQDNSVLNVMRLRLSYGTSGTQNFSPYQAMQTYKYFGVENYNGLGAAYLMGMGNRDLGWQMTKQVNVGLETELWRNRVKLNVDFYNKLTDDMLADITLPLSAGFGSYKANIGKVLNRGVEVGLNVYAIRNTESNIFWSIGGTLAYNKNTIKEISNSLKFLNDELTENDGINPSFLFEEGKSMNTIFAVRSLGIDPSNGKELFLKADGTRSYTWDAKDKVACGVNEPKVWGNLNTMFRWQGLTLNAIFRYRLGGQMYNATLANKVENIRPIDNADRRVLYERWRKPGDYAQFKSVKDLTTTNATTRFVADENTLECASLSLGYEWMSEWLKNHLRISYLSLTAYGEDLFRISTIKQERGINYPYARKFSLALTVRF